MPDFLGNNENYFGNTSNGYSTCKVNIVGKGHEHIISKFLDIIYGG